MECRAHFLKPLELAGRSVKNNCARGSSPFRSVAASALRLEGEYVRVLRCARPVALAAAVALSAACVTINVPRVNPGSYPNYREMAVAQMDLLPWGSSAPRDLIRRVNVCAVDVILGYYTAYELERLDKYARGELHMSDEELKRLDSDVEDRVGGRRNCSVR
jgi:hypothetical protein